MSNRVCITPTEFTNVRSGNKTLGVRVYDDYAQGYDNTWEFIPYDDMEILKMVNDSDNEAIVSMFDYVKENELGIEVDGEFYAWKDIKDILA